MVDGVSDEEFHVGLRGGRIRARVSPEGLESVVRPPTFEQGLKGLAIVALASRHSLTGMLPRLRRRRLSRRSRPSGSGTDLAANVFAAVSKNPANCNNSGPSNTIQLLYFV